MQSIQAIEQTYKKPKVAQIQSGDTVKVHHKIREGAKSRIQIFEGVVIRTHRMGSLSAVITVRRIASNVGVEKTYLLHSPNVEKVEVLRRAKVRRNFLSYLRERRGKSARLQEMDFDKKAANDVSVPEAKVKPEAKEEAPKDAEATEVVAEEAESVVAEVSTEELAAEENKEAGADDAPKTTDDAGQGDEAAMPAEEVQEGLDKAE
jgi:large subunit ribosomal protein L19